MVKIKSIKVVLIRNFVGGIFAIFLIVYFLFNVATNNFISEEAHRELAKGISDIVNITDTQNAVRVRRGVPSNDAHAPTIFFANEVLTQWHQLRLVTQLMLNVDGIIINGYGEIISATSPLVVFLSDYYLANRQSFEDSSMVRVVNENHTYYMMSIRLNLAEENFSAIMYTDITSAIAFMTNINQILGALLFTTGLIGIIISVVMSSRIQKAIVRLCKYAEVIGQGNFEEEVGNFDYKEFSDLAQSMDDMAGMLNAYDSGQKQFFQNVSHELRTPLMSIQGYAEAIFENVLDKKEASEIIMAESAKMERLVSQLLYISRMDSGLDNINISTVDIGDLLYSSAEAVKILAHKDNKKIVFDFPESKVQIKTDEVKLARAIDNIVFNCVRHADTEIVIGYRVEENVVLISISDDGEGINKEDLPHIFERFYMGAKGNSGLGLAISKDIAQKLGGSIVASNNKGAKFVISIPLNC